jgi:hypothetical protein
LIRRRAGFVVVSAWCAASLALGCGWVVGVSGDVTLATDGGAADHAAEGADHPTADATTDGELSDGGSNADTGFDFDAEFREEGEPDRDASARRDARDD